jgi:gentisate 1,2-dioxygenase
LLRKRLCFKQISRANGPVLLENSKEIPMSVATVDPKHNVTGSRQAYYDKISKKDMAPLWEVLRDVVTKEPKSKCAPHIWKFDDVKKLMLEAGDVISTEEAERRVLVLENPAMRGQSRITNSLFAGVQLIMPGEIAEAHKHVSSAIRLVLDGEGAYTAVEGEKANMSRGDFILTPNWAPHDHGNPGKQPVMWLDVLDMPTINHFETSFMEHFEEKAQNTARGDGDSLERYGSGVLPDGSVQEFTKRSPIINYSYAHTKPVLQRLMKAGDIDPRHGARVRYSNPVTGGHVMPTMGAYLSLLPKGFKGKDYQSTDSTIFVCVEGHGSTKVGDKVLEWRPNDVFVVPSWHKHAHTAPEESVLFSISDRPAQEALGIWREKI